MLSMGSLYNNNAYSMMASPYSAGGMGGMMPVSGAMPAGMMMGGGMIGSPYAAPMAVTQTTTTTYQMPSYTPPIVCMPVVCQVPMMMAVPVSSSLQQIPPVPTSIAPVQSQPTLPTGGYPGSYLPLGGYQNFQTPAPTPVQQPVDSQSLFSMLPMLLELIQALLGQTEATDPATNAPDPATAILDPAPVPQDPNYIPPTYNGGAQGNYWGDPHLEGFDGEKYDVMGESGKTYNMLSDKGIQYNTTFEKWGSKGANIISEAGIQVGDQKIYFDRTGKAPTINGQAMTVGETVDLPDGGSASWDGTKLIVKTKEYTIDLQAKDLNNPLGSYLDSHVSINEAGVFSDFVAPHGLLGQTADGIAGKKNTGVDLGKDGGTVIDGIVQDYEEADLWSHTSQFTRFDVAIGQIIANTDSGAVEKVLDTNGNVLFQIPATPATAAA